MPTANTPLMRQYFQIKSRYPDTILLFRMGDFFETFEEDAHITSKILGITLTKRANGAASDVALAGFPHHALDNYLPKLVKAGYKVAICEQLEDPRFARGIVKRDVVEVVTPGVAFSEKLLDYRANNYIACLFFKGDMAGFSYCDITTGEFKTSEIPLKSVKEKLELVSPAELIISKSQKEYYSKIFPDEFNFNRRKLTLTRLDEWLFKYDYARELLVNHFKTISLKGFGIENMELAVIAAAGILSYLSETQKGNIAHISKISLDDHDKYITLDEATKRNLEIISSMGKDYHDGTLISVMDKTHTPMGARLLRKWILMPLKSVEQISKRLDCVQEFYNNRQLRENVRSLLKNVGDMERIIAKIATSRAVPRDLINLKDSIINSVNIRESLRGINLDPLNNIRREMKDLTEVVSLIEKAISEDPTVGVIKTGFNKELDELRQILNSGEFWLKQYQEEQRKVTGISSLKVSYNKVFGYYIEISKANLEKLRNMESYIRKQTLVNAERFITSELKDYEEKILGAEEKIANLESSLFEGIRNEIVKYATDIQMTAAMIATIDVLCCFAECASVYNYVKPEINNGKIIDIKEGRHPVIEKLLPPGDKYVPNDVYLDSYERQIVIITGPNMSGKSSYLRQTGLIVLLAQIGSFVPAASAQIGICDRIFTRVGAMDNIARGESTFLVEMHEAANILNNLTERSLVLLDEVGRGTSTYDGISIAWAITEFIHENPVKAKTLFATHYHELNVLEAMYKRIKNSRVEVKEYGDKIIFLHKITDGTADHSFGIHVAQMAGIPESVIKRAREILSGFEKREERSRRKDEFQISLFEYKDNEIAEVLKKIDINQMTPMEALIKLQELIKLAEEGN